MPDPTQDGLIIANPIPVVNDKLSPAIQLPASEGSKLSRGADRAASTANEHDDFVRAEDRFASFRRRFRDGRHDAELVQVIEHADGHVTYVVKAYAWKVARPRFDGDPSPDATALVSKSSRDSDPITAANPLATADTVARSRALRNLGVLAKPKPA